MKHIEKQHPNEGTSNTEQVNNCANDNSEPSIEDDDNRNLMHAEQMNNYVFDNSQPSAERDMENSNGNENVFQDKLF